MKYFVCVLLFCFVALGCCQSFLDYLNYVAAKELEYESALQSRRIRSSHKTQKRPGAPKQQDDNRCPRSGERYSDEEDAVVDVRFPQAHINKDDEYLCTSHPVPFEGEDSYVVGFTPQASMNASHHMLVFACGTPYSDKPYWSCGMGQLCRGRRVTMFAWARNAPSLQLPDNIGFRIGKSAGTNYIVVQMHYAHRLPANSYDCSGITAKVTTRPQKYYAGIFLLGSPSIVIPPHANASSDVSCVNYVPSTLHVFAMRTHAHSLGTVISGYRVRNGKYKMIGKGNPQWPHAFYTRVGGTIDLESGDDLLARCDYSSNRDTVTHAGMGGSDEMCNFYMMFFTDNSQVADTDLACWGNNLATPFPTGADDLAPFPGFAGQDSMDAIVNGRADIPQVPELHSHHHHMQADEESTEPDSTPKKTHPKEENNILTVSNMKWSSKASVSALGQVGGVAVDSGGFVHVFHRAYRSWESTSFDYRNRFTLPNQPIIANTVYMYDPQDGTLMYQWGNSTFFMPHGAAIDQYDNLWLTDVAMHQVFKYQYGGGNEPLLTLGTRMVPGNDKSHFCKPTDVAVAKDGTIYVSDGYCNGRVVKFSETGKYITSWGQMSQRSFNPLPGTFNVAHSIKLVKGERYVCVADRENGRIQCFTQQGDLIKIIEDHKVIGNAIYAIAYSEVDDTLFAVNGPPQNGVPTAGFTINYETGEVVKTWEPSPTLHFSSPHDIAISPYADELYVGQLSPHRVYQFQVISPSRTNQASLVGTGKTQDDPLDLLPENTQESVDQLEEIKRPSGAQSPFVTPNEPSISREKADSEGREMVPGETQIDLDAGVESPSPAPITSEEALAADTNAGDSAGQTDVTDANLSKKERDAGVSKNVTTVVVVVLLSIPLILFFIGICYVRSRTRRLKKYQDFLVEEKAEAAQNKSFTPVTGKLNLGKFFNKSNPEQQGFERVKTHEDDEDAATDEEPEIEAGAPSDYVAQEYHDEEQAK